MIRILFILGLIFLCSVFLQWFIRSASAAQKIFLKRLLLACGLLFVLYLTATGRLAWLIPIIGGVFVIAARSLPYLLRLAPFLQRMWVQHRANRLKTEQENVSVVETDFIRMKLD
ncbi:MAG: hypothetical protein ACRERS_05570, partial [Methylococcales bacterium]